MLTAFIYFAEFIFSETAKKSVVLTVKLSLKKEKEKQIAVIKK